MIENRLFFSVVMFLLYIAISCLYRKYWLLATAGILRQPSTVNAACKDLYNRPGWDVYYNYFQTNFWNVRVLHDCYAYRLLVLKL